MLVNCLADRHRRQCLPCVLECRCKLRLRVTNVLNDHCIFARGMLGPEAARKGAEAILRRRSAPLAVDVLRNRAYGGTEGKGARQ